MGIGSRIELARKANGLSMRALAKKMEMSAMAISKYERGMMNPGSRVLVQLAQVLHVDMEYFFRPAPQVISLVMYRKHANLGKTQLDTLHAQIQEWLERYLEVESLLNFEMDSKALWQKYPASSLDDVEHIADLVREDWELGLDPIDDLIHVLEAKGLKINLIEGFEGFDACTFKSNYAPVIVVRRDNIPGDRQRFSIAHELGHILLYVNEDMEEKAAHRFAGAFLFPKGKVLQELGSHRTRLSLNELYILKQKYGISMQAIIHRAKDLAIISDSYYRQFCTIFSQQGYRKHEPGDQLVQEHPVRLQQMLEKLLAEDIISRAKAKELNAGPLQKLGGNPQDVFQF